MSSRRVGLVLLCEDSQHEAFTRRFLKGMGWETRELRVEMSPSGRGSAEQWVREKFATELVAYRDRSSRAASALVTMIDADAGTVQDRVNDLREACRAKQIRFRAPDEAVAIAVPKRNIETWIHYLKGNPANEEAEYPRLDRTSECQDAVDALLEQCRPPGLRPDAPPSLAVACNEYNDRIRPARPA